MVHQDSLERPRSVPPPASAANMRIGKALVVDGDEKTRSAANSLLLNSARQPFDYANSLVEAVELLKHNNYVCIFASSEIPAIAGDPPRRQDLENLLDEIDRLKGSLKPPVVCLYTKATDIDDDIWTCWVTDMALRGVVKWIKKPFPNSGRTPDRVLKKVLNGQYVRVAKTTPLTPAELLEAPLDGAATKVIPLHRPVEQVTVGAFFETVDSLPTMDDAAIAAKLEKIFRRERAGNDTSVPCRVSEPAPPPSTARARRGSTATAAIATAAPPGNNRWKDIPNEPITLVDFMAKFCEQRSKESRMHRKQALLSASRHGTIKLPPLAGEKKQGMSLRCLVHDLLATWQSFRDEGVDLPPLLPEYQSTPISA